MSEKFGCHNCKWEDGSTMDEPCYSCNDKGDMIDGVPTNWTAKNAEAKVRADEVIGHYDGETQIRDSGERTVFETGAVRDMHGGKGRMDLLPWRGIIEVSRHCEDGARKYGEHNVDKGIPIHSLCDSAARHLAKYLIGMDDEPHLRAAAWNLLWALEMEIAHPELQDIPSRKEVSDDQR
jgi:hypothetical protein